MEVPVTNQSTWNAPKYYLAPATFRSQTTVRYGALAVPDRNSCKVDYCLVKFHYLVVFELLL